MQPDIRVHSETAISDATSTETPEWVFRSPTVKDGPKLWELVRDSNTLDLNSRYAYLLLCRDFADTCLVACLSTEVVGFVTAYLRPHQRTPAARPPQPGDAADALFVWQIGVAQRARKQGLAKALLHQLVRQPACRSVRYLEATVTPSNLASRKLFQSFSRATNANCRVLSGFPAGWLGSAAHEDEDLFQIGPFSDFHKE